MNDLQVFQNSEFGELRVLEQDGKPYFPATACAKVLGYKRPAYASTDPLVNPCVDPLFGLVTRGSAPYVEWLGAADNPNGTGWAWPGEGYGANILTLLSQLIEQPVPQVSPAQTPVVPDWQRNGLKTLTEAGIINAPNYWEQRLSQNITVGEVFGILGNLFIEDLDEDPA